MVCPFGEHSPSNSTGGACPRLTPSKPAQHVRAVSRVFLRRSPNRSTRYERVVSASPTSPKLLGQIVGRCVDLPADHVPRRRRLLWAYAFVPRRVSGSCSSSRHRVSGMPSLDRENSAPSLNAMFSTISPFWYRLKST